MDQAQLALERAITNFDGFLHRFDPNYVERYGRPTRDTSDKTVAQTPLPSFAGNRKLTAG
jgi:hypothetical protein